jgi:hypothetical protein
MITYKWLMVLLVALQGCAVTTVVDLGVAATTGKTVASHALSEHYNQDCVTYRLLQGQEICRKIYYGQTYHKR